jgi:putative transposase
LLSECEALGAVDWRWQSADGLMNKSRFGGDKSGANPTDRAKPGTKKSLIVERSGGPLGVVVAGANVHDVKLLEATIKAIVVYRPDPDSHPQNLCLDKGYDGRTARAAAEVARYIPQIRRKGDEKLDTRGESATQPGAVSSSARSRGCKSAGRSSMRYDKKASNYLGLLQLAGALLWYRRLHRAPRGDGDVTYSPA